MNPSARDCIASWRARESVGVCTIDAADPFIETRRTVDG